MTAYNSEKKLERFVSLISEHKSANHQLFTALEEAAIEGNLTKELYHLFAVNIAARTMLSLPEIHACCIQASLDLDPLRTSYSVMTGAEEGGSGKPKEVHTVLMMNALNYHGKTVFGLQPLNLKYFMSLVRLLHASKKYKQFLKLKESCSGISDEILSPFVNREELIDICKRTSILAEIQLPNEPWETLLDIEKVEKEAHRHLLTANVLQETIDYCLAQLDVLTNMKTGYLQGVGFAHEALADGMINKMFRIMYAQINRYPSEDDFMQNVYPYFSAHGNYIEVYNGLSENSEGVEVTHAQRELEKLSQLDNEAMSVAWIGTNDFANRNVRIWDGLMNAIESKIKTFN